MRREASDKTVHMVCMLCCKGQVSMRRGGRDRGIEASDKTVHTCIMLSGSNG
jgi:hypothetical protein